MNLELLNVEYGTSIVENYPQSIIAWNLDEHCLLILENYMTFEGHTASINLTNLLDKWYFVLV